ncbi:MAG TPA: phage holin family protein [Actinomycetales bacterium]
MSTQYPTEGSSAATSTSSSDERSIGQIIGDVTHDLTTLVRQELDLAKTEAKEEAIAAGKGAGMFAGAGVGAHLALIFISLAIVFLLDRVMPLDLAALLVGLLWAAIAGVLALRGKKNLAAVKPLPQTTESLKEDAQWLKTRNS